MRELHRSHREQKSTAILLGDVDHFKRVNDTMGHVVGDEVLIEIAGRLLKSVRSYDFVGRYGGEEFLVVLSNCNPSYAPGRAEEIRKSISNRPMQTVEGPAYAHNELWCALELGMGTETCGGIVARGGYRALRSKSGRPELPSDGPAGSKVGNVTRDAASSRSAQTMMKSCVIRHFRRG